MRPDSDIQTDEQYNFHVAEEWDPIEATHGTVDDHPTREERDAFFGDGLTASSDPAPADD